MSKDKIFPLSDASENVKTLIRTYNHRMELIFNDQAVAVHLTPISVVDRKSKMVFHLTGYEIQHDDIKLTLKSNETDSKHSKYMNTCTDKDFDERYQLLSEYERELVMKIKFDLMDIVYQWIRPIMKDNTHLCWELSDFAGPNIFMWKCTDSNSSKSSKPCSLTITLSPDEILMSYDRKHIDNHYVNIFKYEQGVGVTKEDHNDDFTPFDIKQLIELYRLLEEYGKEVLG